MPQSVMPDLGQSQCLFLLSHLFFTCVVLPITFHLAEHQMLQTIAMGDSGASISFINIHFAQLRQIPPKPKPALVVIETLMEGPSYLHL